MAETVGTGQSSMLSGWKFWIGMGVSVFFLALLLRAMDGRKLLAAFREMDWRFMVPAVAATMFSYYMRAYRWKLLLAGEKKASLNNCFSAMIIGYMANNLLPARIGEIIRVYLLGEREAIDKGTVLASLVLDRLLDFFSVLCILLITLFTLRFPGNEEGVRAALVTGGYFTFAAFLGLVAFMVLLKRYTSLTVHLAGKLLKPFPSRVSACVIPLLGSFIGGLRLPLRLRSIAALVLVSAIVWAFAIWPIDLALRSFGIDLPPAVSMFIMIPLVIAVMVPASPGYIGTYHYACLMALTVFGVTDEKALSVALVIHAVNFFPVTLLGLYYLVRDRLSLAGLRAKA